MKPLKPNPANLFFGAGDDLARLLLSRWSRAGGASNPAGAASIGSRGYREDVQDEDEEISPRRKIARAGG